MGGQLLNQAFVVAMSIVLFPTVTGNIQCFCNSPACPEAVCKSSQQCFVKLLRSLGARPDGNASTSIIYGCTEALGINDCGNSSFLICCDTQLCNMPNRLRRVTQDEKNTEGRDSTKCPIPGSAMRVASVVAPSLLIFTVILLSAAVLYKLSYYQREVSAIPREQNCGVRKHKYNFQIAGWSPMNGVWKSQHRYVVRESTATHEVTTGTVNCSVSELCGRVTPNESV